MSVVTAEKAIADRVPATVSSTMLAWRSVLPVAEENTCSEKEVHTYTYI